MKIIFLNGGLANQIFQYIFYRYAEINHPEEDWYLDDSFFYVHDVHNGYELENVFGLKPRLLSCAFEPDIWESMIGVKRNGISIPEILRQNELNISMVSEASNYTQWNPFNGKVWMIPNDEFLPEILKLPGDVYYHGYWLRPEWFHAIENVIRRELTFPDLSYGVLKGESEKQCDENQRLMHRIQNEDITAVHIRRGDYVTGGIAVPDEWYREQIAMLLEDSPRTKLLVFSDDPEYCQSHKEEIGLSLAEDFTVAVGNQNAFAFRDLQLMSQCRRMIIGNSAFSYLAALLNKSAVRILKFQKRLL